MYVTISKQRVSIASIAFLWGDISRDCAMRECARYSCESMRLVVFLTTPFWGGALHRRLERVFIK